ncbi:MAG: oligosaccharide flippase family protein [Lachnospiraceae bacterium]|nr:oligosaccharide flippase family protein [Lachnospiraceae bacterium]
MEQQKSRTEYSAKNTTVAVVSRFAAMVMGFLLRIVFTHTLSEEYVGVDGLFTDIINILSLTELGVGGAITYALYGPIQRKDIETQKSLMRYFKKFYHVVALIVLGLGLALIPFFDVLMKEQPNVEHLLLIYLLYLCNSVFSYLLIYKKTLLDAHQLSYIGILYKTVGWMVKDVAQILVLLYTKNFVLYVALLLLSTLITNVLVSRQADAHYPYLKEKEVRPLPKEQRDEIRKNIKAMLMHKIGNVVVSNTDNLLLSAFVGIVAVGKYSNYYMIIGSLKDVIQQVYQGILASVGNLGVSEEKEHIHKVFLGTFFICQWLSVLTSIGIYEIIDPFVALCFGKQYVFDSLTVVMLSVCFFVSGMRNATLVFRDSLGLFYYDRYKAVAEAICNLVFSLIFVHFLGTAGVFLGTIVSTLLTSSWVEPYILYKYRLKAPVKEYFGKFVLYTLVGVVCFLFTHLLCRMMEGYSIGVILYRFMVCMFVPNVLMVLVYFRKSEFRYVVEKGLVISRKYWRKKN